MTQGQVQLGKNGISKNFIETLIGHFKKHENVKVSILKSAGRSKKQVKEYTEEILHVLGNTYTARTVGFTIFLKRWRRAVR